MSLTQGTLPADRHQQFVCRKPLQQTFGGKAVSGAGGRLVDGVGRNQQESRSGAGGTAAEPFAIPIRQHGLVDQGDVGGVRLQQRESFTASRKLAQQAEILLALQHDAPAQAFQARGHDQHNSNGGGAILPGCGAR